MKSSIKIAKNSAFFTSIIILVLITVAVSTSTFAWFSASNIVNITTISFTANSQSQGSEGIMYINWDKDDIEPNFIINFAEPENLDPMMPLNSLNFGNTELTNMMDNFTTSTESEGIYNSDGFDNVMPYMLCKEVAVGETAINDFYLHNTNENMAMNVSLTYTMEGALAEKLCIAVFVDKKLQYVLCNEEVYYGEIEGGTEVAQTLSQDLTNTINNSFTINANDNVCINMVAWLNGVTINNDDIAKKVTLSSLQFRGAYKN
ncbi:MAG: hypothetical protein WCR54_06765 [Clostridia bacterium]